MRPSDGYLIMEWTTQDSFQDAQTKRLTIARYVIVLHLFLW